LPLQEKESKEKGTRADYSSLHPDHFFVWEGKGEKERERERKKTTYYY